MATEIRFTLNREAIRELARSEEVRREILSRCRKVAAKASSIVGATEAKNIYATAVPGRNRIHGSVMYAGGLQAELKDRVLARSIDAAGEGVQFVDRQGG